MSCGCGRAQIVLLALEQRLAAPAIAAIVREHETTVLRWLKRYRAAGLAGRHDRPMPGAPTKTDAAYATQLVAAVRRRPRSLGLPYSLWTLRRLADYLAEETGVRISYETVRRILATVGIVLSRPQHTISSPDPEYRVKKLGWQTWPGKGVFQGGAVGVRVVAEAALGAAGRVAGLELLAERPPGDQIGRAGRTGVAGLVARRQCRDDAHGPAHDQPW